MTKLNLNYLKLHAHYTAIFVTTLPNKSLNACTTASEFHNLRYIFTMWPYWLCPGAWIFKTGCHKFHNLGIRFHEYHNLNPEHLTQWPHCFASLENSLMNIKFLHLICSLLWIESKRYSKTYYHDLPRPRAQKSDTGVVNFTILVDSVMNFVIVHSIYLK